MVAEAFVLSPDALGLPAPQRGGELGESAEIQSDEPLLVGWPVRVRFGQMVVEAAQQDAVLKAGFTAGPPGFAVVCLGFGRWPVAAGQGAAAVAQNQ